jgi:hypothetical protein
VEISVQSMHIKVALIGHVVEQGPNTVNRRVMTIVFAVFRSV